MSEEQSTTLIDEFIDTKDSAKRSQVFSKISGIAKANNDVKGFWPTLLKKTIGNPQAEPSVKKSVYDIIPYCTLSYPSQWRPYASSIAADLSSPDPWLQRSAVSALCYIPMEIFVDIEARAPGHVNIGTVGTQKPGESGVPLLRAEIATFSHILFNETLFKMPTLLSNSWKYIAARVIDTSACFTEAIALTSALFAYITGVDPSPFLSACQRANPNDPIEWQLRDESVSFAYECRIDLANALVPVGEAVASELVPHVDKLIKHIGTLADSEKWTSICTITCLMGMPDVPKEKVIDFVQGTLLMWLRKDVPVLVYMAASSIITLAAKFPAEGAMWRVPAAISLINLRGAGKAGNRNVCKAIAADIPLLEGKFALPIVSPLVQLVCDFSDQDTRLKSLMEIFSNGLEKGNAPLAQPGALQSLFEQSAMNLVWNTPGKVTSEVLVTLLSVAGNIADGNIDLAVSILVATKGCLEWGDNSYAYAVAYWIHFADMLFTRLEEDTTSALYKSVYNMLLTDIKKSLLFVNNTAIFSQIVWLLLAHLSSDDINVDSIYDHILSSLKITMLKEKEVSKANGRGIRRFKADKNIVIDQLDSALLNLRFLATRAPFRVEKLCDFLAKYSENILTISQEYHDKVEGAIEQIRSLSDIERAENDIMTPLSIAFSEDPFGVREDDKLIISLARAQKSTSTSYAFRQQSFYQTLSGTNDPVVFKMSHKCNPATRRISLFVEASNPMATEMGGGIVHMSTSANVSPCTDSSDVKPQQLMDSIRPLEPHHFCEMSFNLFLTDFGTVEVAPHISVAIQHPLHKAAPSSTNEGDNQLRKTLQRKPSMSKSQAIKTQLVAIKSKDEFSVQDYWPDLYMQPYTIGAIEFVEPFVMSKMLFFALVWPRLRFGNTYQITVRERVSSAQVLELMEKVNFHNVYRTETEAAYSFLSWFDDVFCITLKWSEDINDEEGVDGTVLDMEFRSSGAKALWEFDSRMDDFVSTIFGGNAYTNRTN